MERTARPIEAEADKPSSDARKNFTSRWLLEISVAWHDVQHEAL